MSNHQKRLSVPESWPVERKTETFTVKADAGPHGEAGVPLLIVLRDVLGYVDSRKEARFALEQDQILINGKAVSDETRPVGMFDILAFTEREEFYRVFPGEGGRLALTPIDEESAQSKLGKIVAKQYVPGGDLQLTLHDGETLLVDEDAPYDANDSLVVANEGSEARSASDSASGQSPRAEDRIVAHFEYEAGALLTAVDGQHAGEIGTIEEIQVTPGSADNNVIVSQDEGGEVSEETSKGGEAAAGFETVEAYVVVIDENFVESDDEPAAADDEAAEDESDQAAADEAAPSEDADPDAEEQDEADADEDEVDASGDADANDDEDTDADEDAAGADAESAEVEDGGDDE